MENCLIVSTLKHLVKACRANEFCCIYLLISSSGHTIDENEGSQVADKNNQWFGASLKSAGPDGKVVVSNLLTSTSKKNSD